ncbi:MAG: exodeoxyribonuclease I [Gammaproteobacteria bacterium]
MSTRKGQTTTLYWHDYETTGTDAKWDRPMQFAGVRTDEDLNIIDAPMTLYCRLADDVLPHPEACLITGITPQLLREQGMVEADFIQHIHAELSRPGSCGVGYNSLRFDDEFTRHTLYRNFYDAYGREWQNGNSRWDIIDMVRLTYALRPEGIEWPQDENGVASFRLELLAAANGISHEAAHDAMSDVYATIGLAKLIRQKQPRLYDYVYEHRDKRQAGLLLNVRQKDAVLHTSRMFPALHGCTAMVVPVALHPSNKNSIIVYDLRYDPTDLINLSAEDIAARLFVATTGLPPGQQRIALKEVHLNKCPVLSPLNTLSPQRAEALQIDLQQGERHLQMIREAEDSSMILADKIQAVYKMNQYQSISDPDAMLYSGGFFQEHDKQLMQEIHALSSQELTDFHPPFRDARLSEMLFRYRARNWPATLSTEEQQQWQEFRRHRLVENHDDGAFTQQDCLQRIDELMAEYASDVDRTSILSQLRDYVVELI